MISTLGYMVDKHLFPESSKPRWKPRRNDHVRPYELLAEANATQSGFLLGLYKDHVSAEGRSKAARRKIEYYAFCALIFTALNYWLPSVDSQHTITSWVDSYFASTYPTWTMLLICGSIVFGPMHVDNWDPGWVYHPPLHNRLEKLDAEERERARKFEQQIKDEANARRRNPRPPSGWDRSVEGD
jgi:hypothetical protein